MPSSIPAARANLFDLLVAAPAFAQTGPDPKLYPQVTYGPPEIHERRRVIAILGVESIETEEVNLGGDRQEERYRINMRLKVWDPGCDGSAVQLKALDAVIWGYYETIRALVKANRTLGGALMSGGVGSAHVATAAEGESSGESPVPAVDDEEQQVGWVAFLDMRVLCWARIT